MPPRKTPRSLFKDTSLSGTNPQSKPPMRPVCDIFHGEIVSPGGMVLRRAALFLMISRRSRTRCYREALDLRPRKASSTRLIFFFQSPRSLMTRRLISRAAALNEAILEHLDDGAGERGGVAAFHDAAVLSVAYPFAVRGKIGHDRHRPARHRLEERNRRRIRFRRRDVHVRGAELPRYAGGIEPSP